MQEQQDLTHAERMAGKLEAVRVILDDPLAVAMLLEWMLEDEPALRAQAAGLVKNLSRRRRKDSSEGAARAS